MTPINSQKRRLVNKLTKHVTAKREWLIHELILLFSCHGENRKNQNFPASVNNESTTTESIMQEKCYKHILNSL